jgi:hypothetical protein
MVGALFDCQDWGRQWEQLDVRFLYSEFNRSCAPLAGCLCLTFLFLDPGSGSSLFPPEYVIFFYCTTGNTSQNSIFNMLFKPGLKHHTGRQLQKWTSYSWETHFMWGGFENVAILLTYKIDFVQSLNWPCALYRHGNVTNYQMQFPHSCLPPFTTASHTSYNKRVKVVPIYFNFDTLLSS